MPLAGDNQSASNAQFHKVMNEWMELHGSSQEKDALAQESVPNFKTEWNRSTQEGGRLVDLGGTAAWCRPTRRCPSTYRPVRQCYKVAVRGIPYAYQVYEVEDKDQGDEIDEAGEPIDFTRLMNPGKSTIPARYATDTAVKVPSSATPDKCTFANHKRLGSASMISMQDILFTKGTPGAAGPTPT
ncbi:Uu.00g031950.m01.CDS01 [Anthostomella pinea]|uniref:Uu.00g031950.m01.CDS01 n=1 Tax=Anthostomella pinea TaxID=933095 RepID=A0AAI8YD48_9PEZI|nr:Uu.00g031950.m01.CDS01 [Anthostomella pinea]